MKEKLFDDNYDSYDIISHYLVFYKDNVSSADLIDLNNQKILYTDLTFVTKRSDYTVFNSNNLNKQILVGEEDDLLLFDESYQYENVDDDNQLFYNNFGIVLDKNKYGYINKQGHLITELKYTSVSYYSNNGLAIVCVDDGSCGAINQQGDIVIDLLYDDLVFSVDGNVLANKDGKLGLLNQQGKLLVDFMNSYIEGYGNIHYENGKLRPYIQTNNFIAKNNE